jgi:hypothetical protein
MKKRHEMSKRSSKRVFKASAGTHKKNLRAVPMRGGFRL